MEALRYEKSSSVPKTSSGLEMAAVLDSKIAALGIDKTRFKT
jgi:hypothetical protein